MGLKTFYFRFFFFYENIFDLLEGKQNPASLTHGLYNLDWHRVLPTVSCDGFGLQCLTYGCMNLTWCLHNQGVRSRRSG